MLAEKVGGYGPKRRRRELVGGGSEDGTSARCLEEHSAPQPQLGGGQGDDRLLALPKADALEAMNDILVRDRPSRVLTASDRHFQEPRIIGHKPNVGASGWRLAVAYGHIGL